MNKVMAQKYMYDIYYHEHHKTKIKTILYVITQKCSIFKKIREDKDLQNVKYKILIK